VVIFLIYLISFSLSCPVLALNKHAIPDPIFDSVSELNPPYFFSLYIGIQAHQGTSEEKTNAI